MSKTTAVSTAIPDVLAGMMAVVDEKAGLPAHINQNDMRGNENVKQDDLQTPRLKLLQSISNEVIKQHSDYIEGAEAGMFMNSVTKELFSGSVYLVNLYYVKRWNVWKTQKAGGGPVAFCATEAEAMQALAEACEKERINPNDVVRIADTFEVVETPEHYCLLINPKDGKIQPVVVDMPSTKQKVSKAWNTSLKMKNGARFGTIWEAANKMETNGRKENYFNFELTCRGYVNGELFTKAEDAYNDVMKLFDGKVIDTTEGSLADN